MKRGKRAVFAVAVLLVASVLAVTGCKNAAGDGSGSGGSGGGGEEPTRFIMGSEAGNDSNKPAHQVTLTNKIWISDHEVTQGEWKAVVGNEGYGTSKPSDQYGKGNNFPMYYVSWYDALVYCNKLSIKENRTPCYTIKNSTNPADWGTVPTDSDPTWNAVTCDWNANGYRLPTEAEWEWAARGGDDTTNALVYAGTKTESELGNYAWYSANSDDNGGTSNKKAHAVKGKSPNAYGLYDMSGNLWEWCWDWYAVYYIAESVTDPRGPTSGSRRVLRGGSWLNGAANCAVSYRIDGTPDSRNNYLGFRVVRRP